MTAARVHVICKNYGEERIIPRMARALRDGLGWSLGAALDRKAQAVYLSAYFEAQRLRPWPDGMPVGAYFTHREEEPPNNAKAKLFDQVAKRVQLRIATCRLYAIQLKAHGPTVQVAAPLERERFMIATREPHARPVIGFSGYTYSNHRKGEDLVRGIVASKIGQRCDWQASGRGWPVSTKMYALGGDAGLLPGPGRAGGAQPGGRYSHATAGGAGLRGERGDSRRRGPARRAARGAGDLPLREGRPGQPAGGFGAGGLPGSAPRPGGAAGGHGAVFRRGVGCRRRRGVRRSAGHRRACRRRAAGDRGAGGKRRADSGGSRAGGAGDGLDARHLLCGLRRAGAGRPACA